MLLADQLTASGLIVSVTGFALAFHALRKGNLNASAAVVLTLSESFRAAWARWKAAPPETRNYELHDLLNIVEAACTLFNEGAFAGRSKTMIQKYLRSILDMMDAVPTLRAEIKAMRDQPDTFEHAARFCRRFEIQLFD